MPLAKLSEPKLLCGILTGIPDKYPLDHQNLNRRNSQAVILQMTDDDQWSNMRHYFEFYVTPSGAQLPPPLVKVGAEYQQRQPAYRTLSVDLDRILAVRHFQVPLAKDNDRQNNSMSFWLIPGAERASGDQT